MAQQGNSNLKFIALAVVCVVLIASTVGAFALYLPTQTQITEKDQTIASLNQQIAAYSNKSMQHPTSAPIQPRSQPYNHNYKNTTLH